MDKIKIILRKENDIKIVLKDKIIIGEQHENYDGEYEVTPKVVPQILPTKEKNMKDDVKIKEIPFYEVDNLQNGKTIYIG